MLAELVAHLRAYADGSLERAALEAWLLPILVADPLDVAESDTAAWERAPEETRLFWRLVYLLEAPPDDDASMRRHVGRIVCCLEATGSAAETIELLPLVADAERLCLVADRHRRGIVSRTGFLSLLAESGYPPHVKLWLQHADAAALASLCGRIADGRWELVAAMLERAPGAGLGGDA